MLNPHAVASSVCLAIRWPMKVAAAAVPTRLLRHLIERRMPTTWAIEDPAQWTALASAVDAGLVETSLLLPATAQEKLGDSIAETIDRFSRAGQTLAAVYANAELPRGRCERQLAQLGVRSVVIESAAVGSGAVRPLPFGIWQLTLQATLPTRRRLLRRTGGLPQDFFVAGATAIVSVDLAAVEAIGERAWRETEDALKQAAEGRRRGLAELKTVSSLTGELIRRNAPKPQRSILRAA